MTPGMIFDHPGPLTSG